jgi:hypothetical protein
MLTFISMMINNSKPHTDGTGKAVIVLLKSNGIIEIQVRRGLPGSPQVLIITAREAPAGWTVFSEQNSSISLPVELQNSSASKLDVRILGPSPITPDPVAADEINFFAPTPLIFKKSRTNMFFCKNAKSPLR